MSASALATLPVLQPLSAFDRIKVESLQRRSLQGGLKQLADWMAKHDQKGEQEGLL